MSIEEPSPPSPCHPLWRLAFRAGFLAAGAWGVVAISRWLWWLHSPSDWDYQLSPNWWHAHEMVFGFALPVIAGFLLTAVATWTGLPGTRGRRLQCLFGLWLLARLSLWLAPGQLLLGWALEMLFMLLLVWELTGRIASAGQWRNAWFPPLLLALAAVDTVSHLLAPDPLASTRLFYGMLWLVSTLVVIIGGRVIPLFTANRLGIRIAPLPAALEYLVIGITLLTGAIMALGVSTQYQTGFRAQCLTAAALHLYRLLRWQSWKTAGVPLLWSLHLSYLCIPLTLIALTLVAGEPVLEKHAMHLLAIGTVGGMILSMMSRVGLGHTGRPLEIPRYLALAFALVLFAAFTRSVLPMLLPATSTLAWRVSAWSWVAAFALFLWHYLPILTRARVDGKDG